MSQDTVICHPGVDIINHCLVFHARQLNLMIDVLVSFWCSKRGFSYTNNLGEKTAQGVTLLFMFAFQKS